MNTVGFLIYENAEELDIVGPWEMFTVWSENYGGPERCILVSKDGSTVTCAKGMRIEPHCSLRECPPLDVLIIPGGKGTAAAVNDESIMDFVRTQSENCEAVLSVCTGSFILLAAGMLDGLSATTYSTCLEELRSSGRCKVVEERYVSNKLGQKRIWTSAGVSAGIDMSLKFICEIAGESIAGQVQLYAEYYPEGSVYATEYSKEGTPEYIRRAFGSVS